VEAIARRDAEAAGDEMRRHLENARRKHALARPGVERVA
jgi:DNA-binding FadR family transcriptional regulator